MSKACKIVGYRRQQCYEIGRNTLSFRAGREPVCRVLLRSWPGVVSYQLRRANHHQAIHTGRLITAA